MRNVDSTTLLRCQWGKRTKNKPRLPSQSMEAMRSVGTHSIDSECVDSVSGGKMSEATDTLKADGKHTDEKAHVYRLVDQALGIQRA